MAVCLGPSLPGRRFGAENAGGRGDASAADAFPSCRPWVFWGSMTATTPPVRTSPRRQGCSRAAPPEDLHELSRHIVPDVMIGSLDDHLRKLTPPSTGGTTSGACRQAHDLNLASPEEKTLCVR